MSVSVQKSYAFQPPIGIAGELPFMEIQAIELETKCIANKDHQSEHYKIFFVEEGDGTYQIDFKEFSIEGAGLFCLSPGQIFTVLAESIKTGYQILFNREFYCVETHGKEIACNGVLFNNIHRATFLQLNEEDASFFKQLIQKMIAELENPGRAHQEMLETFLKMFLLETLRKNDEVLPPPPEKNAPNLAGDFIALVDKHFRTTHSVSAYAEMLFVAPKSLAKRLQLHGYPKPTEIIRDRIILEAKRSLRYTNKSIKEIAFELGFEDPAYFTRYFKKAVEESPQNYRTRYQQTSP